MPFELPALQPGSVWLVGAGPGDPGLLTLYALQALRQADAIVHDALIDPRVLELARADAARVFAGKRGGRPSPTQPDISARLVGLAREGKRVLRLKGGDPFVFGRGGEEALALVAAGVPFRVVPGLTAGVAAPAYAGIPLTHRGINSAVTLLTGHDPGARLNWRAIAAGSPVIVGYMALKNMGRIAAELIRHGRDADEPTALIACATTPDQQIVETTLSRAGDAAAKLPTPALIVIGEVVRLRAGLDWQGALASRRLDPDPLGSR